MRKKIAIIINSLVSGGAEKQSALLARSLSQKYLVYFIVMDGRNINQGFLSLVNDNKFINPIFLKGGKLKLIKDVYKIFNDIKPEVSFSYLPSSNLVNGVAGKFAGVKYRIGGIRNAFLEKSKFLPQKLIHNYLLQASISNSLAGKISHVQAGQNKAPVFHIPNCYPLKIGETIREQSNELGIVSVGRFVEQKNYELAIIAIKKCAEYLKENNSNIKLKYNLIGYGNLENQIRDWLSKYEIEDITEIILDPPNMSKYYECSDIYLCTSTFEGLSNSIMEAMSFSLPVVATNVGGNPELVANNINGYITDLTPENVYENLIKVILDFDLRSSFGKQSFIRIKEEFSEEAFFNKYDKLIESGFRTS